MTILCRWVIRKFVVGWLFCLIGNCVTPRQNWKKETEFTLFWIFYAMSSISFSGVKIMGTLSSVNLRTWDTITFNSPITLLLTQLNWNGGRYLTRLTAQYKKQRKWKGWDLNFGFILPKWICSSNTFVPWSLLQVKIAILKQKPWHFFYSDFKLFTYQIN